MLEVFLTTETRRKRLFERSSEIIGHEGVYEGINGTVRIRKHMSHDLYNVNNVVRDKRLKTEKDHDQLYRVQWQPTHREDGNDNSNGFGDAASGPGLSPDGSGTPRVPLKALTGRH